MNDRLLTGVARLAGLGERPAQGKQLHLFVALLAVG